MTIGNTVIIEASIDSIPSQSEIQWMKNNKEIDSKDIRFFIDSAEKSKPKLKIRCLRYEDDGKYSITVKNAFGPATAHIEIKVGGKFIFSHSYDKTTKSHDFCLR